MQAPEDAGSALGAAVLATDADDVAAEDSTLTFESSASCVHDVVDDSGAVLHRTFRARSSTFHAGSARTASSPSGVPRTRSFAVQKLEGSPPHKRRASRSASKHASHGSWSKVVSAAAGLGTRSADRPTFREKAVRLSVVLPCDLEGDGSDRAPALDERALDERLPQESCVNAAVGNVMRGGASDRRISFATGTADCTLRDGDARVERLHDALETMGADCGAPSTLLTMLPANEDSGLEEAGPLSHEVPYHEHGVLGVRGAGSGGTEVSMTGGGEDTLEPPAAPRGESARTMAVSERFGKGCRGVRQRLQIMDAADVPARLRQPEVRQICWADCGHRWNGSPSSLSASADMLVQTYEDAPCGYTGPSRSWHDGSALWERLLGLQWLQTARSGCADPENIAFGCCSLSREFISASLVKKEQLRARVVI